MNKIVAAILLAWIFPICQPAQEVKRTIILPSPKLLTCKLSDCSQLWANNTATPNAVFPKQLVFDLNQQCIYGMTARYDKDVSLDELKAAIGEHYQNSELKRF